MITYKSIFSKNAPKNLRADFLADPDGFLASGLIIKNDRTTTVAKVEYDGEFYSVKRYNARNQWHKYKRAFRQSRAENCWQASLVFSKNGVVVPEAIAMVERRLGVIRTDAYFLSRWIDGVELLDWLPKQDSSVVENVGKEVRKLFAVMSENALSHGDMKATNLLWYEGELVIVDLDSAKKHRSDALFKKAYAKDLARFSRNGVVFANLLNAL